jgi:hypothetical protein
MWPERVRECGLRDVGLGERSAFVCAGRVGLLLLLACFLLDVGRSSC